MSLKITILHNFNMFASIVIIWFSQHKSSESTSLHRGTEGVEGFQL